MNEYQLGAIWRDVVACPPAIILQVVLEGVLYTTGREERGQG